MLSKLRTVAADAVTKLGTQIGVDMAANIFKEFSSDLNRKVSENTARINE